ncbi:Poly(ADP-ribose) polymerase catalytic domain [Popillia japonica]
MGNLFGSPEPIQLESRTVYQVPQITSQFRSLSLQDRQIQRNVNSQQPPEEVRRPIYYGGTVSRSNTVQSNTVPAAIIVPRQRLVVERPSNPLSKPKLVAASNSDFISNVIRDYTVTLNWDVRNYEQSQVYFVKLDEYDWEYEEVESLFNDTNKRCFEVTQIERIQNPYLLAAFLLKKEEMSKRIG